ncbi:MAG: tRNA pseudouridine(38-40) synthase TruA [Actinobacteria bacterium]|nr:tRNA pseudouridine(38-40) synthase TruA [Actinomycetota bacterium]MCL6104694.1 tRNA pseudouridine(38-40) synthase TruA [Actinomycetota bacterium]
MYSSPSPKDSGEPDESPLVLLISYDGTDFHGFAYQDGLKTVEGTLRHALSTLLQCSVTKTVCAGRTDAGVHAWGQVVHVDVKSPIPLDILQSHLNSMLKPHIQVRSLARGPVGFHARYSADARLYRYFMLNSLVPNPFLSRFLWHIPTPLDLTAMQMSTYPLIGEHDFSAFCRKAKSQKAVSKPTDEFGVKSDSGIAIESGTEYGKLTPEPVDKEQIKRRVIDIKLYQLDNGIFGSGNEVEPLFRYLVFEIKANAFCHQMVRSIVGTVVDIGRGKIKAGDMMSILNLRNRSLAGCVAPPNGLFLWDVIYPRNLQPKWEHTTRGP